MKTDEDNTELSAADYLADLATRLMRVPIMYGTDQHDSDRLSEISKMLRLSKTEMAALIPKPDAPVTEDWPCENDADKECLQRAYGALQ